MGASGSGFRVVEEHDHAAAGDPKVVIYRLDPATLDFLEVSGNAERLLGFPLEEWFRPRFWSGRLHPDDQDAARAFLQRWASARRDEQIEYRVIDAGGRAVWVRQVLAAEHGAGRQEAVRGVLMDVTGRIAAEANVEKALFLKAELFRIIVEELAPPVRAISVFGEMLERHLAAQRDDVGSDYAVGLRGELERLDTMLAQLMRVAQDGVSMDEMNAGLATVRGGAGGG